jgi:endonuclease/exonuclease/phosphatase family metal-dependent hydrolase
VARIGDHPRRRTGVPPLEALAWSLRALLAVLAVAAGACSNAARPVTSPSVPIDLAIVTWNMHIGAGDLPRLLDDLSAGRLTPAVPANYVLLLQEATDGGPYNPAPVARERQLSFVFQPLRLRKGRMVGNVILSTLPLSNVRLFDLPRERVRRGAIIASTVVAGQELFVVDVHLENRVSLLRGLLFSDGPRGRQARALMEVLPAGDGIAGGDLNTWLGPEEPALKAFAARFPDTPTDPLQPTVRDRLILDHLFFDVPDGWQVRRWSLRDYYGSDHRPVVGVVNARP